MLYPVNVARSGIIGSLNSISRVRPSTRHQAATIQTWPGYPTLDNMPHNSPQPNDGTTND